MRMDQHNVISISTVTPVYQGADFLSELVAALNEVREQWLTKSSDLILKEAIFVCDSPKDNSIELLKTLASQHHWVHVITLSKNYGQHAATVAGISHSSGDWIITLDEDLQHHPKYITHMLRTCVQDENDLCYANSRSPIHRSWIKDAFSKTFKKLVGFLIGNKNVRYFNSFRCIRGSVARAVAAVSGPNAYFDVTMSWFTNKITYTEVELVDIRNNTQPGASGYTLWSLIGHGRRMITSAKIKFLRFILILGGLSFTFSIIFTIYVIYRHYVLESIDQSVRGWPSTIISIFFFGGLTCLFLGLIIENLTDVLQRMRGRPTYFVVDRSTDAYLREILSK